MTRKEISPFAGAGADWPGAFVGFYTSSACTNAVTVFSDPIAGRTLASGKTGGSPVRRLQADGAGQVPSYAAQSLTLWVDSTVTALYARPETRTGVAYGDAVSVASFGPDEPTGTPETHTPTANLLAVMGSPDAPITDAGTPRLAGYAAIYWIMANGVTPTKALAADQVYNAPAAP